MNSRHMFGSTVPQSFNMPIRQLKSVELRALAVDVSTSMLRRARHGAARHGAARHGKARHGKAKPVLNSGVYRPFDSANHIPETDPNPQRLSVNIQN